MVKRIVYTVHGMLKCSSLVNGVLLAIPLFFIFCFPTMAMNPVKNCHCFKERTYNPQNKFSSDNYILTTTTNSFISVWFKFNKKNIVMMKMKGGVNSDDLLIGLYVASLTGEKIDGLIQLHQQGKTWKTILTNEQLPVAVVKDPILSSLANGVADQEGANRITNSLLSRFFSVSPDKIDDLKSYLMSFVTEKTSAIYFNTPNNPTGIQLREDGLKSIASFAIENDLWIIADEAYEDFTWSDDPHICIASLPGSFERTVSVFTFSKSYAAAGLRLGYIVAPDGVIAALNPANVATGYEPNRLAQVQWIRGLSRRDHIVPKLQNAYREGLDAALSQLTIPHLNPEGSFYIFLDLRDRWIGLTQDEKMNRMLEAGVVVAPGEAFGEAYDGWARFCYTALKPDDMADAAKRANNL